jgi:hypothetical protein
LVEIEVGRYIGVKVSKIVKKGEVGLVVVIKKGGVN